MILCYTDKRLGYITDKFYWICPVFFRINENIFFHFFFCSIVELFLFASDQERSNSSISKEFEKSLFNNFIVSKNSNMLDSNRFFYSFHIQGFPSFESFRAAYYKYLPALISLKFLHLLQTNKRRGDTYPPGSLI